MSARPAALAPDAPDAERRFQAEVRGNLRRNFIAWLAHGLFGQTGFRLIHAPSFIPAYVFALGGSEVYVGLARAIQALGQCLMPLFSATRIEHRRHVLPVGFVVGGIMRLQVLGIALAGFFLPAPWALAATITLLGLFGFFLGMQGVIFSFLMSKVIPVDVRGRLQGVRNFLAGLLVAGVGVYGGLLVEWETFGNGYATTFLLAFVLTAIGLAMLGFMREAASPSVRERSDLAGRLRDVPGLMRRDREFTVYFAMRALAGLGRVSLPYVPLHGMAILGLESATEAGFEIGVWTAAWSLAQTVSNLGWGLMADRRGFRSVFLVSVAIWIGSVVALMAAESFLAITAVFVGIGVGMGGFQLSNQNMILEFGSRENLPMRIGLANTALELTAAIGLVLGGVLAATTSYAVVFWIAIACQTLALAGVLRFVPEPRHRGRI